MKNLKPIPFKRKLKGRTNYRKRITLLKSDRMRLVVRRSSRHISAYMVSYNSKGDKVVLGTTSKSLEKYGWNANKANIPAAYLLGLLVGKKALEKEIKSAILDMGMQDSVKGSMTYALISGVIDAGLNIPHNPNILPPKERIQGIHISKYAQMLKKDKKMLKRYFGNYIKNNLDPEDITKHFEETKSKILKK